jgi:glycosyltransferase involved in cell wall biosynthesis
MHWKRPEALLVTPLPPQETGLATYAVRILENTADIAEWTVACPGNHESSLVPDGIRVIGIEDLQNVSLPDVRVFQLGNSAHCFPVAQALYRYGGTTVFHETVLHHMLRDGYIRGGRQEEYMRELRFCHGPSAESVLAELSCETASEIEYDRMLKRFPLIGRALHASNCAACLNEFAAEEMKNAFPENGITVIGHPLSPLPVIEEIEKPFGICIGMVGGYHPGRNLEEILEAMPEIRSIYPSAGLVLIGGGYPAEIPEWVYVTGRLPEPEYQGWIRSMDLVIDLRHPSCGETSGSLLEVMRAGIPSIVSASGSFLKLPSDGVLRIPPESLSRSLPRAVELLLDNGELRLSMVENAKSYAEDTGSVKRLAEDWRRLLSMSMRFGQQVSSERGFKSISAAWNDTQGGFSRCTDTRAVTWQFSGTASIRAPGGFSRAWLTAWGRGSVCGEALDDEPSVMELECDELLFRGEGFVTDVLWS